ncbi:MAG: S-adenosylmethionine:tRNA ribosyltransferase-isomerase [Nocardioidaceae bacterium]|nr:S-adenosylmethionine:tRNA ribosyltransferase-isomerase [Nocardioidaceae bacterium]
MSSRPTTWSDHLPVDFVLPDDAEAHEPAEARGIARDDVRMLVTTPAGVRHARVRDLAELLAPGDLLVVNTSATLPAALDARRIGRHQADGRTVPLHVGDELEDGRWVVELRHPDASGPARDGRPGERLGVGGGLVLTLGSAYPDETEPEARLWTAVPSRPVSRVAHLHAHGRPVRYGYVEQPWPLEQLQTVFGRHPGSAEMPSAGRPFTERLVVDLVSAGVSIAPIVLHCGLSSPEAHEPPGSEPFAVPGSTAALVNHARARGGRVIAVGTTVTRALETAADPDGIVGPAAGRTDLVLGPGRPARVVDGLLTGLHAPQASHLLLLEAVAGTALVRTAYRESLEHGYLWHEFGDTTLFLPAPDPSASAA